MMKKTLFLLFLVSTFSYAQFTIKGTLTKTLDTDWVILYKIEGITQKFIQNTTIKKETLLIDGQNQEIGNFEFHLPVNTLPGSYRIQYRTKGVGFLDFIYNQENVQFTFHPDYPEQTVSYAVSKENKAYKNYLSEISTQQQKLDSLQKIAFKDADKKLKKNYKEAYYNLLKTQQKHLNITKGMYVEPFIRATLRANPPAVITDVKEYVNNLSITFFDHIDFTNKNLINSAFLLDRITDYIFYINYSDDQVTQQKLYKNAIDKVFTKINNENFKKNVIKFLINEFEKSKNIEIIDYLFANYFDKLSKTPENQKYKKTKLAMLRTEVGRIAPDFSWIEEGKTFQLSTLNDAENYILVFWSTECSHCLREVPLLYNALEGKNNIKVIAFAMEHEAHTTWGVKKKMFPNWHHVLGLQKWKNKTARMYNINATPTYFVLDKNKKIIAKPEKLSNLKQIISQL